MRYLTPTIALIALLGLAACAGPARVSDLADDANQRARDYQLGAGLNVVEFEELECSEATGLCGPTNFRMIGGKEQEAISIRMVHPETGNTVLEYTASGVKAFDGQRIRAEVEQALAEADVEVADSVVTGIVDIVRRAATGGL
jgi:citrate lyase gamma subunit